MTLSDLFHVDYSDSFFPRVKPGGDLTFAQATELAIAAVVAHIETMHRYLEKLTDGN